jgi:hypothetical protein
LALPMRAGLVVGGGGGVVGAAWLELCMFMSKFLDSYDPPH